MTTCIRRDHTVWTTCPCEPCRRDARRTAKLSRLGRLHRASGNQATVRILTWERDGYTPEWIASACGLSVAYVQNLMSDLRSNRTRSVGPTRSAQILRADITTGTSGKCSAVGATRRLQALAWLGYDGATISREAGISLMSVSVQQRGTADRISAPHWHAIRDLYDRVGLTPGPSTTSARRARRLGWVSPLAWDEGAIDDPNATPDDGIDQRPSGEKISVDDIEDCASWGLSRSLAAMRLAVDPSTIEQRCRRENRLDLLERLDRNAIAREAS